MHDTYVGFEPSLRVVLRYLAHALQTTSHDDVHPRLDGLQHVRLGFAESRHELERALPDLILLSTLPIFPVLAISGA